MTGTQISDMDPSVTLPDGAVVPFVVPPATPGFDPALNYIYDLGADLLTRVSYTALAAPTAAAQVGSTDGNVQADIDARPTTAALASSTGAEMIGSFDNASINPEEAYSGTGTATSGAPRWYLGNLTPTGDDSALCVGRDISGNLLFSHAVRDESEFVSTGDSAYTSIDASATYNSNGGAEYNHGYGFQWRSLMAATNGMDLFAGFVSFPRVSAGTVDRLFHFHAQGWNKTGGTVSSHQGFYCSPLTADVGVAHAFFAESNPSFFGGYVQMDGDDLFGFGQARGNAAHFKGTVTSFEIGGGVFVGGQVTGAGYAEIRAYEWDGGTLGPRGLALNTNGGQVLVGTGVPTTGADFEVDGRIAAATLTLSGLPTYADDAAAGSGGLTAGQVYKTAAGALMVKL